MRIFGRPVEALFLITVGLCLCRAISTSCARTACPAQGRPCKVNFRLFWRQTWHACRACSPHMPAHRPVMQSAGHADCRGRFSRCCSMWQPELLLSQLATAPACLEGEAQVVRRSLLAWACLRLVGCYGAALELMPDAAAKVLLARHALCARHGPAARPRPLPPLLATPAARWC